MLEKWRLFHQLAINMEGITIKETNPNDLLGSWPQKALGRALQPTTREAIKKFLDEGKGANWQPTALALVFMSPDFQWS
jgi:hypothetical protein